MKKLGIILLASICLLGIAGCEKVAKGQYKEGTYEASTADTYNGENNTATAKVIVNSEGKIESVYLDTTYNGSTKKTLGDDYNMKKYNPEASGEWYEQVTKLETAIVENQGVSFITLDSEGKTDTVSGCTINISALVEAAGNAIDQAK